MIYIYYVAVECFATLFQKVSEKYVLFIFCRRWTQPRYG